MWFFHFSFFVAYWIVIKEDRYLFQQIVTTGLTASNGRLIPLMLGVTWHVSVHFLTVFLYCENIVAWSCFTEAAPSRVLCVVDCPRNGTNGHQYWSVGNCGPLERGACAIPTQVLANDNLQVAIIPFLSHVHVLTEQIRAGWPGHLSELNLSHLYNADIFGPDGS